VRVHRPHLIPGAAAFAAALLVALLGLNAGADSSRERPEPPREGSVTLRLLGVNDFHGHLEPPRPGIGGAAWLKAHLDSAELPGRTIRVHAGDMVGASPLISAHFRDEPSIEVSNEIGFDVGTLGNHEFDDGGDELLRLVGLSRFPMIAANTHDRDGRLALPPTAVVERAGVRVGFIGVTTPSTPRWLLPRHGRRFRFSDVSDAVNRWVPELERRGVHAIVVLAHEGAPADGTEGPILAETAEMDDAVDLVVAGHSHSALNVRVPKRGGRGTTLVVEALSYGVAYDKVDMTVDRRSGDVMRVTAELPETRHGELAPDAGMAGLVERYAHLVAPLGDRVVGHAGAPLTRAGGELLPLVAAGVRRATGADVGLASPVSLRADIDAGPIEFAEVFKAQAYDHPLVVGSMSGAALMELRDAQPALSWAGPDAPIDPRRTYSVAASELLAAGLQELRDMRPAKRRAGEDLHDAGRSATLAGRPMATEAGALAAELAAAR
jgi:5'-nucleotidase